MLPFPQSTISNGCQVDTGDGPPGGGSRFFAPGEDILSQYLNRAPWALVQNDEYLDGIVADKQLAYTEVAALAAFSGNSVDIDPTGGAGGDVNFSGYVYVGDSGWLSGQEALDTLFKILDTDYNEVLVDGVEVKVTSISGTTIGSGFYNGGIVTLNLNKTLPAGGYRVVYGRDTTLENMPTYALIRSDVRGLHEAPGEAARVGFVVCDPAGGSRPADYVGANSLEDALNAGEKAIFLRSGTYGPYNTLSFNNCIVIGEDSSTVIRMDGVSQGTVTLNNAQLWNVDFNSDSSPTGANAYFDIGDKSTIRNVRARGWGFFVNGSRITIDNVEFGGTYCLSINSGESRIRITNALYDTSNITGTLFTIGHAVSNLVMENIYPFTPGSNLNAQMGLYFSGVGPTERIRISNSVFETGAALGCRLDATLRDVKFENVTIKSERQVIDTPYPTVEMKGVHFDNCNFVNTATDWYTTPFVEMASARNPGGSTTIQKYGIRLTNCYFFDQWCQGHDDGDAPGTIAQDSGAGNVVQPMLLSGVCGENIIFDRGQITHIVQDSSWLFIGNSMVRGVQVLNYNATVPEAFRYEAADRPYGLVWVGAGAKVEGLFLSIHCKYDFTAGGPPYHQGKFWYLKGVVAAVGADLNDDTVNNVIGPAVIDGVEVYLHGDSNGGPLLDECGVIGCGDHSRVSNFTFTRGSSLYDVGNPSFCIVLIAGKGAYFDKFAIVVDSASYDIDVNYIFAIDDINESCSGCNIRDGRVYVDPDGVTNRPIKFAHVLGDPINCRIEDVEWIWDGNILVNFPLFDLQGTTAANYATFMKFLNNHIRILGSTVDSGSGYYECVKFYNSSIGGAPGNSGMAIGNTIQANGATFLPEIEPNTVTGYALNVISSTNNPSGPSLV